MPLVDSRIGSPTAARMHAACHRPLWLFTHECGSERNTFRDFTRYHVGGATSWGARVATGGLQHRLRVGGDFAYQDGAIQFYDRRECGR